MGRGQPTLRVSAGHQVDLQTTSLEGGLRCPQLQARHCTLTGINELGEEMNNVDVVRKGGLRASGRVRLGGLMTVH